jgi:release factor glutamine methyltransferase
MTHQQSADSGEDASSEKASNEEARGAQVRLARTVGEALRYGATALRSGTGATPDLDAQVLLAHVSAMPRALLLAYPERALSPEQAEAFAGLIERRLCGEPVAYLTGHREFLGFDLKTDRRALIPRPETELLVEAALTALHEQLDVLPKDQGRPNQRMVAADIGTGTGAIALALAALEPRLDLIYATDVSADALALAAENAERLGLSNRVRFVQGDLLAPLPEPVDLLLANLPYVARRDEATLAEDVRRYEPELALYGEADGLAPLRRFFATAPEHVRPGALVGVEFGYDQRGAVEEMAHAAFPAATVRVGADYGGWDRYALIWTAEQRPQN